MPGYLLRHARVEMRLVYTAFLALTLLGMATVAAFQLVHVGPTPARIAAYYRGGSRGDGMAFTKTFRELVEVTHFHTFTMSVAYLILAHLLLCTAASERVKRIGISAGFLGLLGDLLSVWLIRYGSPAFAYLQLASWAGQWVSYATFVYCPVREMWFEHADEDLRAD
jgi:hypothetical protein